MTQLLSAYTAILVSSGLGMLMFAFYKYRGCVLRVREMYRDRQYTRDLKTNFDTISDMFARYVAECNNSGDQVI